MAVPYGVVCPPSRKQWVYNLPVGVTPIILNFLPLGTWLGPLSPPGCFDPTWLLLMTALPYTFGPPACDPRSRCASRCGSDLVLASVWFQTRCVCDVSTHPEAHSRERLRKPPMQPALGSSSTVPGSTAPCSWFDSIAVLRTIEMRDSMQFTLFFGRDQSCPGFGRVRHTLHEAEPASLRHGQGGRG